MTEDQKLEYVRNLVQICTNMRNVSVEIEDNKNMDVRPWWEKIIGTNFIQRISYETEGGSVEAEKNEHDYLISLNHGAKTGVTINIPIIGSFGINGDWGKGIRSDVHIGASIAGYGVGLDSSTHFGGKGGAGVSLGGWIDGDHKNYNGGLFLDVLGDTGIYGGTSWKDKEGWQKSARNELKVPTAGAALVVVAGAVLYGGTAVVVAANPDGASAVVEGATAILKEIIKIFIPK